jgi:hypothetical protein
MNKLARVIVEMDEAELRQVKRDLEEGNFQRLINQKIAEKVDESSNKICPVCHTAIEEGNQTLVFGPAGLRKKATFCALDCLEFFISRIKEQKRYSAQQEEEVKQ